MGLLIKKPKEKYEKTLLEIPVESIRTIKRVTQRGAQRKLSGDSEPVKSISQFMAAVSVVIHEIILENGDHIYFEIMDKASLEKATEV